MNAGDYWRSARAFPHADGGAAWLDEHGEPDDSRPVHTGITPRMAHVYSLGHLLSDPVNVGWFSSIDADGNSPDEESCYAHAFVLAVWNEKLFDPAQNLYVDHWDNSFTTLEPCRGGNMHAAEALLAASDATGDPQWRRRALGIARRVADWAPLPDLATAVRHGHVADR